MELFMLTKRMINCIQYMIGEMTKIIETPSMLNKYT